MTDKLTEALNRDDAIAGHFDQDIDLFKEVARRWHDFPTDEDVDLAMKVMLTFGPIASVSGMRAALEAVKREDR